MNTEDLSLEDVDLFFGKKQILRGICLRVRPGEICGLLGPSGCGKTTLVRIAAGILRASRGRAVVLGESMPKLLAMARIGYMAQGDALYPALSAEENLQFFGSVYGLRGKALRARIAELAETVNLSEDMKKPVHLYSGGMKRRLSLIAALLHKPSVLILDEPTVGIDPLLRRGIWAHLRGVAQEGAVILVTTHVMDEAEQCNRIAMLRDGALLALGTRDEILSAAGAVGLEEAFVRFSGGAPEEGAV
ncbi:MAG: ABC transporter ATP-binding protein [Clostridiales Family XIII bacterium]|jgi:ABC-2 type transport system ATP-binding protein|nr:ABC transporter ATP-binding protein [Clostridiales Family XIII bacterium]